MVVRTRMELLDRRAVGKILDAHLSIVQVDDEFVVGGMRNEFLLG